MILIVRLEPRSEKCRRAGGEAQPVDASDRIIYTTPGFLTQAYLDGYPCPEINPGPERRKGSLSWSPGAYRPGTPRPCNDGGCPHHGLELTDDAEAILQEYHDSHGNLRVCKFCSHPPASDPEGCWCPQCVDLDQVEDGYLDHCGITGMAPPHSDGSQCRCAAFAGGE